MDRYVVMGNPVAHSQSPFIHAAFAEQTGAALQYGRLLCGLGDFEPTLRAFTAGGGRGCNVTVPFKFDAFRLAHRHTPRATLARACNVLRCDADGWLGDNTDGIGLLRDIERNAGVAVNGRRILLLGAGGAAAGVLGPLLAAGPARLVVANRTLAHAVQLLRTHRDAIQLGTAGSTELQAADLGSCGDAYDIVINATSSSMLDAAIPVSPRVLAPGALAVDLMYGPAAHGFVDWAAAHGAVGRDGLGMLVEQAAEAFALFRDIQPDTGPVLAALRLRMAAAEP